MNLKLLLLGSAFIFFGNISGFAQTKKAEVIKCSSTEYDHEIAKKYNITRDQMVNNFENWIQPLIEKSKKQGVNQRSTQNVVTIPVVFHVFHNGDAVGTNENLADLQLQSQITVLNQDFRRMLNTPGFNNNAVGADIEVEFCLAQVNPSGNFTTGINRYQIGSESLSINEIESIKQQYIWDSSKYLNLFVATITPTAQGTTLGYAQFPLGSGLPGLDPGMSMNDLANTDGVVIHSLVLGSRAIYPQGYYAQNFDAGRTASHEVGHWLGLRHIWGDQDGCNVGTDYCDDTPVHNTANETCAPVNTCGYAEMIENYMDYSGDHCLNTFTLDQKTRIRTVLQNDPRRASLLVGNRCTYTVNNQLDLGLNQIDVLNPSCNAYQLSINIVNQGSLVVNSVEFELNVNGTLSTFTSNQVINSLQSSDILHNINLNQGSNNISVRIISVNGGQNQNTLTNSLSKTYLTDYNNTTSTTFTIELITDFFADETSWSFVGPNVNEQSTSPLNNSTTYNHTFNMVDDGCYTFTINDSEADGICCTFLHDFLGQGNLKATLDGNIIYDSGDFGSSKIIKIYKGTLSTGNFGINNSITLYPNPTNNILNVQVSDNSLPTNYTIYNTLGQVIKTKNVSSASDLGINVQTLTSGIYFIKLNKEGATQTLRFIKN